jgi:mRNA-degrading endonuclease RelE of RelBE toxin-antitoxin system
VESYTITWRKSTKKDLRKIPEGDVLEILAAVEALAGNPFPIGSMKLSGTQDVYRIRVAHRKDVYR